jgi:AraC-like DNA-binding protein
MAELRTPQSYQRVGFLAFLPALLQRFGSEPAAVLAGAGLGAQALDNPEDTIAYTAAGRLLEIAAEKTRCPFLGLEIGKFIRSASLGLVGELMRNAPTLGIGLLDFASYQYRNAQGGVAYLLADKHDALFGYAVYQPGVPGHPQICDAVAMGAFNLVRELAGSARDPVLEVLFSRSEPSDLSPYRRAFGVRLRFNAEQTAIRIPGRLLDQPVVGADAGLRLSLAKRVATGWQADELDTATRVRRALRVALISGHVSAEEISSQLGMSHRTLHRRLEALGLKFREVLSQTRCEFAEQLLANTRLGIGEIAGIIGYNDPSVLTRSFIRWAGVPPIEWRRKLADTLAVNSAITDLAAVKTEKAMSAVT